MIVYRFHPFFGRHVTVLRRIRNGNQPAVIVLVEPLEPNADNEDSQLRINVPNWMLDAHACASIVAHDVPQVDGNALINLRKLLDQLGIPSGQAHVESGSMVAKGDRHETTTTTAERHSNTSPKAADV